MIVTVIIQSSRSSPAEVYTFEAEELKMFLPTLIKTEESRVEMVCTKVGRISVDADVTHIGPGIDWR